MKSKIFIIVLIILAAMGITNAGNHPDPVAVHTVCPR